jgi:hypothetical protein
MASVPFAVFGKIVGGWMGVVLALGRHHLDVVEEVAHGVEQCAHRVLETGGCRLAANSARFIFIARRGLSRRCFVLKDNDVGRRLRI